MIKKDFANVYKWLQANKLQLIPAKSNSTIVAPKMNTILSQICLTLNDTEIPYFNNVKYLGVHDPQLNFQAHIRATEQRIPRSTAIISTL